MGGSAGSSIGGSGGPAETDAGDQIKSDITVGGKKNKTHYGKKFGNKHKGAMMEFTKTLWLQDSTASLRNLLQKEVAQQKFREFLALEYGEAQLDFIVEVFNLEKLAPGQKEQAAVRVYQSFMGAQAGGIGQQERTKGTQQLWDSAASAGVDQVDPNTAYANVKEECDRTLNMLGFDAFPRFLKSKYCIAVMDELKRTSNPNEVAALEGALNTAGSKMAKDADDWLNMFVSTAESFPACIVISDMTIPGAPMVFVNSEFSRTTGYAKEEAVGRNCRFLQGPDTEPESIAVIRNTLSKGQDCHVKLTNYRKNGEKFQNLLSMKPVFDGDGIYRYVIGVQFEIIADQGLKKRLVQLDKLLRLLPSRLNLKSKASAQARGALAAKVTGEANQMISAKEQILNAGEQREEQEEVATGGSRPKGKFKKKKKASGSMMGGSGAPNYDGTIFAFTKIMWLQDPVMALRCMLLDQGGYMALDSFLKQQGSVLAQTHLRFWAEAQQIMMTQGPQQMQAAKALHRRMVGNALFYCTTNEIVIGQLNRTSWPPIIQEMARWQEQTLYFLASDTFARFMEGNQSREYLYALRAREVNGEQLPIKTAAHSKDTNDPNFWMEIFKTMSESLRFGCVVSDMTIPGIPLAHVNEGFRAVTGYGKEVIGKNCKFLTGPATEMYLTEEIMEALRHADPLFTKLHNHKANGQKFQCLLVLHPVFTPEGEYKYQIGGQIDYNPQSPETPMLVMELERVFRNLPQVTTGVAPAAMASKTQEMEAMLGPLLAATGAPSQSAPAAHTGYGGMQQPMQAQQQQQWGAPAQSPMQQQQQWGAPSPVAAAPPAQQWGASPMQAQQPPQQQQQWGAPAPAAAAPQWGASPAASPMMQQQQPPQQQWGAPAAAAPAAQQWGAPAAMSTGGWGASPAAQSPPTQQQWGAPAPSATMPVAAQWGAAPQMGMPNGGGMQPMPPSNGAPSWAQDQQPRPGAQWAPQQPQW
jgi:PAS domain S-box-containing protein